MRNKTENVILGMIDKKMKRPFVVERRKKFRISEHDLQKWAAEYFDRVLIPTEAIYLGHESGINLGREGIRAQQRFKEKGVKKGSQDGFIFYKNGVVCLEFKVGNNKPTSEQEEFANAMALIGYPTEFPRTQEDVIAIPKKYNIPTRHGG